MSAKLTLMGLYNYDPTLFDSLTFPEGIDKQTAINTIILRCAEFETLYPNLEFLKFAIGAWGTKHERTFAKWYEALELEYNPLDNYDRHEEYTDTEGINKNGSHDVTVTSSRTTGNTNTTTNLTRESQVSAYDQSSGYTPKDKDVTNGTVTDSGSESGTDRNAGSDSETESRTMQHYARTHGNIGVTTSMALLREQLSLVEWNLYDHIADLFADEFCIQVYV